MSEDNNAEDNRDALDEETRELVDRIDEQVEDQAETDGSGTVNEGRDPEGQWSEDTDPHPADNFEQPRTPPKPNVSVEDSSRSMHHHDANDGATSSGGLWSSLGGLFLAPVSKMPKKVGIYKGMIKAGYQGMQKNTSANVIVNVIYGDRYVVPRLGDINDKEGVVETENGERYALPDGMQTYRIGDAMMMWAVADAHELVSPVGARTAEKIDLDDAVWVQSIARDQPTSVGQASQQQVNQAVADGGYGRSISGLRAFSLDKWNGEPFEDVYVNWANDNPDADGMIVSMEKHYELQHSQAGSEEMKKQEDRGRLAERTGDGKKSALIYVALFAGGAAAMEFLPAIGQRVSGSGGDGGSRVPLAVDAMNILPQLVM